MKRLFIFVFFLTLLGCSKSNTQDDLPSTDAKISISQNSLLFDASGTEKSITVYSNSTWTLSGGEFWCKPSATKGENFDTIIFRSEENPNKTERKTEFIFTCGTATTKLVVTQKPAVDGNISLSENNLTFDVAGGEQSISVYSSTSWTLTGGESWCRPSAMSGSSFDSVIFKAEENVSPDERNAVFTFNCDNATAKLLITQKQADALTITSSKIEIGNAGGEVSVEVKANINFDYKIQDDCKEWVSYVTTRALTTSTLIFNVAPSEEAERRTGTISIFSGDKKEDVTIYQSGEHILVLTQNEYNISADGETIAVELKSNLDYTYEIPADAPWITKVDTRAISTHTCYLSIEPNLVSTPREATIIFTDKDKCRTGVVRVKQKGLDIIVVNVREAGTLMQLLAEYKNVVKLKVTGMMNDEDFAYLRSLSKLSYLDISGVQTTTLPTHCFREADNIEEIILPNALGAINSEMFYACKTLKTIHIPASVEIIEAAAFKNCTSLRDVSFGEGAILKTIGGYGGMDEYGFGAFLGCTALTNITIPASVEEIQASAFKNCTSLQKVVFEEGSQLRFIGGGRWEFNERGDGYSYGAFKNCKSLTAITIPANVDNIESHAFEGCSSLATLTFAEESKLKIISKYAFATSSIEELKIPESIVVIESAAFYDCKLDVLEIPINVEYIGPDAFSWSKTLSSVHFEKGSKLKYLSGFSSCKALSTIDIPASVEEIGERAFAHSNIISVTFAQNSSLKTIGIQAFWNTSISSIEIPASVEEIDCEAFYECGKLSKVIFANGSKLKKLNAGYFYQIPDGMIQTVAARKGVFAECSLLSSIEIPASVENIGAGTFLNCTSLSKVSFETGSRLKKIDGVYYRDYSPLGAFQNCSHLTKIEIPASVEEIGPATFKDCVRLISVDFEQNSNLTKISGGYFLTADKDSHYGAFLNCRELSSIVIPANVEEIGMCAFMGCRNLKLVDASECEYLTNIGSETFRNCNALNLFKIGRQIPPTLGVGTFDNISETAVLKVPVGCIEAYKKISGWNNFTEIVILDE